MFFASDSLRPEIRASSGADAVFTSAPTALTQSSTTASSCLRQQRLVDVVLILADADRLGLDAHELGQRILQPPRDRHRAAQRHVEVGKLLRRRAPTPSRPRRRPRRPPPSSSAQLRMALIRSRGELVGFARRGAVADRDELHAVCRAQRGQRAQRAVPVLARLVRIDGRGVEQLAGAVDDRRLDAGADARGPAPSSCAGRRVRPAAGRAGCGRTRGSLRPRPLAQPLLDLELEVRQQLDLPGPADGVGEPGVGRPAPVCSMPARAAMRRSGSVGPAAPSASGSTTARRRMPSLRPRNSASARCDGTRFSGSLALK